MKNTLKTVLTTSILIGVSPLLHAVEGSELWTQHCKKCHGADGAADTAMGRKLNIKDYTNPAVQSEFTDEEIAESIREGIKSESGKLLMPKFDEKIAEEDIPSLVAYLRSLQKS